MVLRQTYIQGGPVQRDSPFPRSPYVGVELLQTARTYQAWESAIPQLAAQELHLKGGTTLVLSSYHRGGIDWDLLGHVMKLTKGGNIPFILYGDFNASPQALHDRQIPSVLNAVVVDAGRATCKSPTGQ